MGFRSWPRPCFRPSLSLLSSCYHAGEVERRLLDKPSVNKAQRPSTCHKRQHHPAVSSSPVSIHFCPVFSVSLPTTGHHTFGGRQVSFSGEILMTRSTWDTIKLTQHRAQSSDPAVQPQLLHQLSSRRAFISLRPPALTASPWQSHGSPGKLLFPFSPTTLKSLK